MARTGIAFLSNFVNKAKGRINEAIKQLDSNVIAARVVDVSLNSNSTLWDQTGRWKGVGTIQFQFINSATREDVILSGNSQLARPLFPNIKQYPLVNEVVLLFHLPTADAIAGMSNGMEYYYLNTISLWNHPEQNSYPNPLLNQSSPSQTSDYEQIELGNTRKVNDESTDLDLNGNSGGDFVEKGFIHPIIPYAGDVILEGRFGNSVRFGSTQNINGKAISNNWSSTGESGSPIVILKNGQNPETQTEEPGWVPVSENINEDLSSIYLTSNQQIPIEVAVQQKTTGQGTTVPFASVIKDVPEAPFSFQQQQIILNSGRLLFNSSIDDILLSSQKSIVLESINEIGIKSQKSNVNLVAEKGTISLGKQNARESLVLGDSFMTQFTSLLDNMEALCGALKNETSLQIASATANLVQEQIKNIKNQVPNLTSNLVKTG